MRALTTDEFIARARALHGDKYCYNKVEYVNNHTKVIITCPIHGDFPVLPNNHTSKKEGCPECGKKQRAKARRMTKEAFIVKARKKHGDKYDYSLVEIKGNNKTKVKIKCNACGTVFEQTANNHLNRQGCPKCNSSHLETVTRILLEKNGIDFEAEKTFPWLKNEREMPLDFYLPGYNIAIECQGKQHYESSKRGFFTKEIVNKIKQRDKLKHSLCQEHGIQIYYIKYDEDVNVTMAKFIKSIS